MRRSSLPFLAAIVIAGLAACQNPCPQPTIDDRTAGHVVVTEAGGTQIAGDPSHPLVNFPDDSHLKVDVYPSFGVVVSLDTPTRSGTFQLADVGATATVCWGGTARYFCAGNAGTSVSVTEPLVGTMTITQAAKSCETGRGGGCKDDLIADVNIPSASGKHVSGTIHFDYHLQVPPTTDTSCGAGF